MSQKFECIEDCEHWMWNIKSRTLLKCEFKKGDIVTTTKNYYFYYYTDGHGRRIVPEQFIKI